MDRAESTDVLDALIAGYPRMDLEDTTLSVWVEAIEDSGADAGRSREVARRWPRTHERFPSLAEFLAVITPHVYVEPVDDPDEMRPSPQVARQLAGYWRNALAANDEKAQRIGSPRGGTNGHWHGGPDPCPMCGGLPR